MESLERGCYGPCAYGSQKGHRQHEVDIEAAAGEPEKLRGMEIRTFEQFQDEFLAKLKSANRQCAAIAGRVNILIQPIRLEFAEAIDGLADNLARDEEASAAVFGLAFEPSQTVMQLRKGAVVSGHPHSSFARHLTRNLKASLISSEKSNP